MFLILQLCIWTAETLSLGPMLLMCPEFSCTIRPLPVGHESVLHAGTPVLPPELPSNNAFHPDLPFP